MYAAFFSVLKGSLSIETTVLPEYCNESDCKVSFKDFLPLEVWLASVETSKPYLLPIIPVFI